MEEMMKALRNKGSESYPCLITESLVKGMEKDKRKVRNHKKPLVAGALRGTQRRFPPKNVKNTF